MAQAQRIDEISEEQLRLNHQAGVLFERIKRLFGGRDMTPGLIRDIEGVVRNHRDRARQAGVDFPVMVVFPLVRIGQLEILRRDLIDDERAVATAILNIIERHKRLGIQARDIAVATQHAWPGWKGISHLRLEPVRAPQ